jgi:hypothetical protein
MSGATDTKSNTQFSEEEPYQLVKRDEDRDFKI